MNANNARSIVNDDTILNLLYQHYAALCQSDSESISSLFSTLYASLDHLNLQRTDQIIDTVCSLCSEHEKQAFLTAIKIGYQLALDLSSKTVLNDS